MVSKHLAAVGLRHDDFEFVDVQPADLHLTVFRHLHLQHPLLVSIVIITLDRSADIGTFGLILSSR
jgi:hypothetical protein